LTDDNISSNVPKFDDLASDDSQLVIPQGEDEHDNSTFSGIVPYSTTVGGITVTGGVYNTDYLYENNTLHILTRTPLHITTHNKPVYSRIIAHYNFQGDNEINISLHNVHLYYSGTVILFPRYHDVVHVTGNNVLHSTVGSPVGIVSDGPTFRGSGNASLAVISDTDYCSADPSMWNIPTIYDNLELTLQSPMNTYVFMGRMRVTGNSSINGVPVVNSIHPKPELRILNATAQLVELHSYNNIPQFFGNILYSLDGISWTNSSGIFANLKSGTSYTIFAKYPAANGLQESPIATQLVSTEPAFYEVTIPSGFDINDGVTPENITVKSETLDLGHNGQVDVKIVGGSIQDNGRLQLSHLDTGDVIRSQLYVNSQLFQVRVGDVRQSVATFTMTDKDPVPISFAPPDETNIVPGTYEGTVVFGISYSD